MSDTPADPFGTPPSAPPSPAVPPPGWAPAGWTPGYAPQAPDGPFGAPAVAPRTTRTTRTAPAAAPVPALVGFAVVVTGLFALPLNGYSFPGSGVGFVETREGADLVSGSRATGLYSGLAQFWWLWGAFVVCVAMLVALALAVSRVAPRVVGLVLAGVAVAGGVVHALAMARSVDYRRLQAFGKYTDSNFYDHPGAGVWVSIVGFGLVLVGGIVIAATGRRH